MKKKVTDFEQEEKKEELKEVIPVGKGEKQQEEPVKPTSWWKRAVDTLKSLFDF